MAPNIWSHLKSDIVSFLKFVYAAACIHKLLFTGEEGMALVADVHFQSVYLLGGTRFESGAASAYNRYFMIIGMYFGLHITYLAVKLILNSN